MSAAPRLAPMASLIASVEIQGFRSIRHSRLDFNPLCALVGEAETGKSNVLAALHCVLDPSVDPVPADLTRGGPQTISLRASLGQSGRVQVVGRPPTTRRSGQAPPPVLFLPAAARDGGLLAARGTTNPAQAAFR